MERVACPRGQEPGRVMFLCTGNSCCSQMAEGFARALEHGLLMLRGSGIDRLNNAWVLCAPGMPSGWGPAAPGGPARWAKNPHVPCACRTRIGYRLCGTRAWMPGPAGAAPGCRPGTEPVPR